MTTFSNKSITKAFKEMNQRIDDLWCFIKECCAKIPVNIGNGVGLFKRLYKDKWEFKSIIAGNNVTITEQDNTITINASSSLFDCDDVKDCLGIISDGDPTKFLNEQGDWETISLTGSSNRVPYFDNNGDIKTNANFVYNETSNIFNAALPITGGFYQLSSGASKIGAGDISSPDAYFQATPSSISWGIPSLSADTFLLPYNDGNSGDVLTTDGLGNLTFQTPSSSGGTVTSVAALTLGTTGTDLSSTVANSTTTPVITLNVPTASSANRGVLSSTDWSTFNNKQDSLGFTPENVTNKSDSYTASSSTTYATTKAVVDGLATKFYPVIFLSNQFDPANGTNYFFGGISNLFPPSTTNTDQDFKIGYTATIVGCVIQAHGNSIQGTSENVTLSLRNNTTNTTTVIGTFKTNATSTTTVSTVITDTNIAVSATDDICLQINGTWATRPQSLRLTGQLNVLI